ncbi:hypothetical protein [Paenibacillus abyssi]|nr:hypothetical protein [Paenibacillus abyssi]
MFRVTFEERLEELRKAWRGLFDAFAESLRLRQVCEWLADKLTKRGR